MQRYVIPKFTTTEEFLQHLARRHGRMKKGGIPDLEAAARIILQVSIIILVYILFNDICIIVS